MPETAQVQPVVATPEVRTVSWDDHRCGRRRSPSAGRCGHQGIRDRAKEREFWDEVATGKLPREAAEALGVAQAVWRASLRTRHVTATGIPSPASSRTSGYIIFPVGSPATDTPLPGAGPRFPAPAAGSVSSRLGVLRSPSPWCRV